MLYLKSSYNLANYLGLAPSYDFDNNKECYPTLYKIHGIFNTIFVTAIYIHFMINGVNNFMTYMYATELLVDNLEYFLITLFSWHTIIGSFTFNKKNWLKILNTFHAFDKDFGLQVNKKRNFFNLELLLFNIIVLSIFLLEILLWFNYNFESYINYVFARFEFYYIFITIFVLFVFSRSILFRYKCFNNLLLMEYYKLKNHKFSMAVLSALINIKLHQILKFYKYLNCLIDCFNKLYGWTILIYNGIIIMACLECINFMVLSIFIYNISLDRILSIPVILFTSVLMVSYLFLKLECKC